MDGEMLEDICNVQHVSTMFETFSYLELTINIQKWNRRYFIMNFIFSKFSSKLWEVTWDNL